MKPAGSTSDGESFEFDRMKQVCSEYLSDGLLLQLFAYCVAQKKMGPNRFSDNAEIRFILKEILEEVVRELQKVKEEIIDGTFSRGGVQSLKWFKFLNVFIFVSFV